MDKQKIRSHSKSAVDELELRLSGFDHANDVREAMGKGLALMVLGAEMIVSHSSPAELVKVAASVVRQFHADLKIGGVTMSDKTKIDILNIVGSGVDGILSAFEDVNTEFMLKVLFAVTAKKFSDLKSLEELLKMVKYAISVHEMETKNQQVH